MTSVVIRNQRSLCQKILNNPLPLTCVASTLLFFFFFKARYALLGQYITFARNSDDSTYIHYLVLLSNALGITSGISEAWMEAARQFSGPHPPGISLAWLPAAIVARFFHLFGNLPYSELLVASLGALNWFYFCLAMFLFLRYTQAFLRPITALTLFLTIPILYYSTHRTSMTHPAEAVLNILLFHELLKSDQHKKSSLVQVLILTFLTVIRYQYVLLIPVYAFLLLREKSQRSKEHPGESSRLAEYVTAGTIFMASAFLVYAFWPSSYITSQRLKWVLQFHTTSFRWLYSWFVPLIDPSWGILYLSGGACVIILYSLVEAVRSSTPLSWKQKFVIVWIIYSYFIGWFWGKQGDDVQYRFLVPLITLAPFLVAFFPVDKILSSRLFRVMNCTGCFLSLLLVWMVKTKEYLTVTIHATNFWMTEGWNNFWLIPKMIYGVLTNPVDLFRPLALSPPGTLMITALHLESMKKYELSIIAAVTLAAMMIAHLFVFTWAIRQARSE